MSPEKRLPRGLSAGRKGQEGRATILLVALAALLALSACRRAMVDQPKVEPYEASSFFADGLSARPVSENTVPRSAPLEEDGLYTGRVNGEPVTTVPLPLSESLLERGQERYDVYCTPCHGRAGYGDGIIVQRGFPAPPSFHQQRLRRAPDGYYFDVISNGLGAMYSYANRVPVEDRWAIIAHIRALQFSQNASLQELPAADVEQIEESGNGD